MKITFLAPHIRIAGGVRAILTYADRLAGRGHDVTVIVPAKRPWRAWFRNLRGQGPDWIPGFRARVRWVSAWDPARLPSADAAGYEDYPALAKELEFEDTVKFIGPVEEADKPALYRGATVFTYPSRYEGFGLPPLEAMACGVPVVTTTGGSLPEVMGKAGYLVPPDDTRTFGAAIITIVVEPSVHDDLRARGLAQAKEFSWEKTARETAAAYEAAAKPGRGGDAAKR